MARPVPPLPKGEDTKGVRERLREDLEERYPKLLKVIDDGMTATKKEWVNCPHCKKRSQVEITDTKAAIAAAEFVANQSFGRPGEQKDEKDEQIVFERIVYLYDAQQDPEELGAA